MHAKKRKTLQGRGTGGKKAVAGIKDRKTKKVRARVVDSTDAVTLQSFVRRNGGIARKLSHSSLGK